MLMKEKLLLLLLRVLKMKELVVSISSKSVWHNGIKWH